MNNIGVDRGSKDNLFNFKYNFDNDLTEDNSGSAIYNDIGHTCEYFELDGFQQKVSNLKKQISFFSSNIRSLPGKWNEFPKLIDSLNFNQF